MRRPATIQPNISGLEKSEVLVVRMLDCKLLQVQVLSKGIDWLIACLPQTDLWMAYTGSTSCKRKPEPWDLAL